MKLITRYCSGCDEDTEQAMLGFIPGHLISGQSGDWAKSTLCSECGAVAPINPDEGDLDRGEKRVVKTMYELDLITEEEARRVLT